MTDAYGSSIGALEARIRELEVAVGQLSETRQWREKVLLGATAFLVGVLITGIVSFTRVDSRLGLIEERQRLNTEGLERIRTHLITLHTEISQKYFKRFDMD